MGDRHLAQGFVSMDPLERTSDDMRKWLGGFAMAVLLLAGSAAPGAAPAAPGTISVETAAVEANLEPSLPLFVEAVGKALAAHEFTLIEGAGHAHFVANLTVTRVDVGTTTGKVPVAGPTAMAGGRPTRAGGGVNFSLPTGKIRTVPLQQTKLELSIRQRGDDAVLWRGSALTVRATDSANGQDGAVAKDLAEAIFRGYPEQSEGVASIP